MKKASIALLVVLAVSTAGAASAGDWNLAKNVKRLERVSPEYHTDK